MRQDSIEVQIGVRGPLVIATNPDGTETIVDTRERLVRVMLGEFSGTRSDRN